MYKLYMRPSFSLFNVKNSFEGVYMSILKTLTLSLTLISLSSLAILSDRDKQGIIHKNLLENNGSFEAGKARWTASGSSSLTLTSSGANLFYGNGSGDWDASASGEYLTYTVVAIPAGFYSQSGILICYYKTAASDVALEVYDGSSTVATKTLTANSSFEPVSVAFDYPASGNITMRFASSSDSANVYIDECFMGLAHNLYEVGSLSNWYIDANIAGANPSLGAADVSTYTGITDSSLTLTQNTGSQTALIACATTEESSGTTCTGNESIGFSASIPKAGPYFVKIDFGYFYSDNSGVSTTFQIVETPNNAQTISQQGKDRKQIGGAASNGATFPVSVSGILVFSSSGKKTIRLFYEQDGDGAIGSSVVAADAAAAYGQPDIHIYMAPINRSETQYQFDQVVSAGLGDQRNIVSAELNCDGSSAVTSNKGTFVSAIGNISSGTCAVTVSAGVFDSAPHCTISPKATNSIPKTGVVVNSTTSITIGCEDAGGTTDCTSFDSYLTCSGEY